MKKHIIFSGLLAAGVLSLALVFAIAPTAHAQIAPTAHAQTVTTCPAGYTCTPVTPQPVNCPVGFTCAATNPVTTPSTAPTISITQNGSVPNSGIACTSSVTCTSFTLTAGPSSNMKVNALSVDFNTRPWLYFSTFSLVNKSTGSILSPATPLTASNFTEITVGSDYRYVISIPNLVISPNQSANVLLIANPRHGTVQNTNNVISASVRAVDSSGVTHTASTFNSSSVSGIVASLDPASPQASMVQISTSAQTNNVPLAVFDVKSQGVASTLQSLQLNISPQTVLPPSLLPLFNNLQIKVAGLTYGATTINNGTVTFNNLSVPLPANTYVPITVYVNVAQDTNNSLDGLSATVSLPTGNIQAIDSNYNSVPVSTGTISGNTITFSSSGVQVSNTSAVLGNPTCSVATQACTQQATFTFSLTAGNQPIFVSNKETTALAGSLKTSLSTSLAVSPVNFSDNDTSGDSSTYFYVAPGQTKTFTAIYQITANGPTVAGVFSINPIFYGTSASNLTSNSITSGLQNLQVTVSFNGGSTQLPSLSINPASVVSGQKVTFSYVIPSNATSMGLFLSCPTGVSMPYGNGGNENCNTNMKWSPSFPTASIFTAINNSSIAQTVGAFLQVTYPDGSSGGINGLFVIQPAQSTSTQPSITVVSPNGGETWVKGTTQYIKWTSTPSMPYQLGQPGDIKLEFAVPACAEPTANPRCMIAVRAPLTIASGVNLNSVSYAWKVGQVLNNTQSNLPSINIVPDGQYKIQICPTNVNSSTQCDDSNNYFNITSGTPTPVSQPPVITGGTFPTTLQVNQTGTWTVNAYDPKNGSLSYSVNWGDVPYACQVGQPCVKPMSTAIQSSTFTHSYSYSGTYTITFTVKNAAGLSAQTTSTVKVVTTTPVCPAGYICTPPNQTTTCPAGYTCTNVTPNCPPNYICYTQTPTLTPIINSSNSYQSSSSKTSTVTAASTQSGWQSFLHFLGF